MFPKSDRSDSRIPHNKSDHYNHETLVSPHLPYLYTTDPQTPWNKRTRPDRILLQQNQPGNAALGKRCTSAKTPKEARRSNWLWTSRPKHASGRTCQPKFQRWAHRPSCQSCTVTGRAHSYSSIHRPVANLSPRRWSLRRTPPRSRESRLVCSSLQGRNRTGEMGSANEGTSIGDLRLRRPTQDSGRTPRSIENSLRLGSSSGNGRIRQQPSIKPRRTPSCGLIPWPWRVVGDAGDWGRIMIAVNFSGNFRWVFGGKLSFECWLIIRLRKRSRKETLRLPQFTWRSISFRFSHPVPLPQSAHLSLVLSLPFSSTVKWRPKVDTRTEQRVTSGTSRI